MARHLNEVGNPVTTSAYSDLIGKVAVVTGSSRGIGRGIAARFAEAGALVAVHYGGKAFALQADLSSVTQIQEFYQALDAELIERTGSNQLDVLVNNAGMGTFATYDRMTEEEFDQLFAINVKGAFFMTRLAIPRLRDGGRIINISSAASRRPSPRAGAYAMTKAALNAFTTVLAADLGKRSITANTIAPGSTETDVNAEALKNPEVRKSISEATALGRIDKVADIAGVAAFLASADSAWVTGQYIEASGGLRL